MTPKLAIDFITKIKLSGRSARCRLSVVKQSKSLGEFVNAPYRAVVPRGRLEKGPHSSAFFPDVLLCSFSIVNVSFPPLSSKLTRLAPLCKLALIVAISSPVILYY